jgi:hypothetical protein
LKRDFAVNIFFSFSFVFVKYRLEFPSDYCHDLVFVNIAMHNISNVKQGMTAFSITYVVQFNASATVSIVLAAKRKGNARKSQINQTCS